MRRCWQRMACSGAPAAVLVTVLCAAWCSGCICSAPAQLPGVEGREALVQQLQQDLDAGAQELAGNCTQLGTAVRVLLLLVGALLPALAWQRHSYSSKLKQAHVQTQEREAARVLAVTELAERSSVYAHNINKVISILKVRRRPSEGGCTPPLTVLVPTERNFQPFPSPRIDALHPVLLLLGCPRVCHSSTGLK